MITHELRGNFFQATGITHSHRARVVRSTTQVNGKTGNSTPCHAQTP